ncbi:MAG: hypothetical protein R6V06_10465 [Kiritimatiellia bacterium]
MIINTCRTSLKSGISTLFIGMLVFSMHAADKVNIKASPDAVLTITEPEISLRPQYYTEKWHHGSSVTDSYEIKPGDPIQFTLSPKGEKEISGTAIFKQDENSVNAEYTFTAKEDIKLNKLYIGANLPVDVFAGASWSCNGRKGILPKTYKDMTLMYDRTHCLTITTHQGRTIRFDFPEETSVYIQDSREWSNCYSLRIGKIKQFTFKKGKTHTVNLNVSLLSPIEISYIQPEPVTLTAGEEWTPLHVELEIAKGSALDFSDFGFTDAPAGKHGYVTTKGPHFVFEDKPETPQRFYGVNFCFSANYIEQEAAEKLAERLARIGYNTIRVHHHERIMTKGSEDATELNEENMKKFDGLMAALIEKGIYISTDLYVSREVPWKAIGVDKPGIIPSRTYKKLIPVHEGAFNNLKKYVTNWLTHVNPHTGRSYAEEPALAWINLLNEANFGNSYDIIKEIPEWTQAWQKWLAEKKKADPDKYSSIPDTVPGGIRHGSPDPHSAAFLLFFRDKEIEMVNRFKKLLRDELGCKALISNANGWSHYPSDHFVRSQTYDYIDDHFYVDHPHFLVQKWRLPSRCPNRNPVKNDNFGCRREIYMRHFDKPFTISEYNYSGPGRFRGVGGILCGTLAALQDWSILWRFAYSHSGPAIESMKPSPMGYFDMLKDPLSLAAERASICLFLRKDIKPLSKTAVIYLPSDKFESPENTYYLSKSLWPALGWSRKVGIQAGGTEPEGYDSTGIYPDVFKQFRANRKFIPFMERKVESLVKDNKALSINNETGTFIIDTEKTCGGFTEGGLLKAGPVTADIKETAATVWVSSVDSRPVSGSSRMILTHLTDIQNTNIQYVEPERKTLLKWGQLPHLVRKGRASIKLALNSTEGYKVYALTTGGRRVSELPVTVTDNRLCFDVNTAVMEDNATIVYEIVKE